MKKRLFFISILFSGIALSDDAYQWETALTLESIHNLSGGVKKDSAELANLDITLAIDTQAADLWESGEFFFYVLGNYALEAYKGFPISLLMIQSKFMSFGINIIFLIIMLLY